MQTCSPGDYSTISNAYGELDCRYTSTTFSNDFLTVNWKLKFYTPSAGTRNLYMLGVDKAGATAGWYQFGTFYTNDGPTLWIGEANDTVTIPLGVKRVVGVSYRCARSCGLANPTAGQMPPSSVFTPVYGPQVQYGWDGSFDFTPSVRGTFVVPFVVSDGVQPNASRTITYIVQ